MEVKKQLVVLALDGVPFSLLNWLLKKGVMPHLQQLVQKANFQQILSVHPPISSVAWAAFLTGAGPAQSGITGFLERNPATLDWFLPNASHLKQQTLLQILSAVGKRVFSMNVPVTYPPQKINGISICGFLGSDLAHCTYPPAIGAFLKAKGYKIDADVEQGKKDLMRFYHELVEIMEKRFEILKYFWGNEHWDFFMGHIMETDRLHHFFWKFFEEQTEPFYTLFLNFYQKLDEQLKAFFSQVKNSALMLLSDHGFTRLRFEVNLNRWLHDNGYLNFKQWPPKNLHDLHPSTKAYSLYPGRIYLNLKGREKNGTVEPGVDYENLCNVLTEKLQELRDPQGQKVIAKVVRGYEIYEKQNNKSSAFLMDPVKMKAVPDLLAIPHKGYDLKGNLWTDAVFKQTEFSGTHTFDDAFLLTMDFSQSALVKNIQDVHFAIRQYFGV